VNDTGLRIACMGEKMNEYETVVRKCEKRPLPKFKRRLEIDIKIDLR
jgi:hypothetical protein